MLSLPPADVNIPRPEGRLLIVSRPFGSLRNLPTARPPACGRSTTARNCLAVVALMITFTGCAALRRGPVTADVVACRDLTQQGVTAMETGHWAEAEELLQRAAESSAVDAAPHRYLAEVLWQRGATEAALREMDQALELDPDDSALNVRCGEMLLGTGKTNQALEFADKSIMLNPKSASAWALRGRAYWRAGQTELALADLQRSLQFAPDASDVLMDIAAIYRQRRQHDRCLTTLQHLLDTYPPGQGTQLAYWMEGLALADLGRPEQAAQSLRTANQVGPPNADILYYLAQVNLAAGQRAAAVSAAQEALVANASHQPSRRLMAMLAANPAAGAPAVR